MAKQLLALAVIFFISFALLSGTVAEARHVREWGELGTSHGFQAIRGIAIDSSGNVYVVEHLGRVEKFTGDGKFIKDWGYSKEKLKSEFFGTAGIAIDSSDNIYVIDLGNVYRFTNDGKLITQWPHHGFPSPTNAIAIDSSDNVYIADQATLQVLKFNSDGKPLAKWKIEKSGPDGIIRPPLALTVGSGNVYVTTETSVQKFTSDGKFVAKWGDFDSDVPIANPWCVVTDSTGNIYVCSSVNDSFLFTHGSIYANKNIFDGIVRFTSDGKFISKIDYLSRSEHKEILPVAAAINSAGVLYIGDDKFFEIYPYKVEAGKDQSGSSSFTIISEGIATLTKDEGNFAKGSHAVGVKITGTYAFKSGKVTVEKKSLSGTLTIDKGTAKELTKALSVQKLSISADLKNISFTAKVLDTKSDSVTGKLVFKSAVDFGKGTDQSTSAAKSLLKAKIGKITLDAKKTATGTIDFA